MVYFTHYELSLGKVKVSKFGLFSPYFSAYSSSEHTALDCSSSGSGSAHERSRCSCTWHLEVD